MLSTLPKCSPPPKKNAQQGSIPPLAHTSDEQKHFLSKRLHWSAIRAMGSQRSRLFLMSASTGVDCQPGISKKRIFEVNTTVNKTVNQIDNIWRGD